MAGLRLIVGPPNSGRAGEIRRLLAESAERDPVLVVPTGDDAAWFERELCADGSPALGIAIRTFAWLFEDVAEALEIEARPQLSAPQRLALIRAAVAATPLTRLRRSSSRAGFAPALDALLEELGAALVTPEDLRRAGEELADGAHEAELAALYETYVGLRDRARCDDRGSLAAAVIAALRARPDAWDRRPVFLYGFDDLTRAQLELVAVLCRSAEVTIAVNYEDRRALTARATLLAELRESLGAETLTELEFDPAYTERASLRHLSRSLFEARAEPVEPDDGIVLMESAGERGEAEAIGLEIARILAAGADPGEVAVAVRSPSSAGPEIAATLSRYGIPVALEADAPLTGTSVGRALVTLCRAADEGGRAEDLLAHLRADPTVAPGIADWMERGIRRGEAATADEAVAGWAAPPRHLARLRAERDPGARLRALAEIGHEVAEGPHREAAPLAGPASNGAASSVPLDPLELRAAVAAAELLEELAVLGELPGCEPPGLREAAEALEGASVRLWRGPTDGRVRILSPYRLRTGRVSHLFCASLQDGEFPAATSPDPLLGDDRRAALGIAALRRQDAADEERYLFHACVSRPTERLYVCWRSCDDEGKALARSPFVDEVLDLIGSSPQEAEAVLKRTRGIERVVADPGEAPSERELARTLAVRGRDAGHAAALERLGVGDEVADRVLGLLAEIPDPEAKPGPLAVPVVLEELRSRRLLSAGSLERWLACPYRWFVDHELSPQRLEPEGDPLWLGGVVHDALEDLYAEAPGSDSIPRAGDVGQWKQRFAELLEDHATRPRRRHDPDDPAADSENGGEPERVVVPPVRVAALARARRQVESFLDAEAEADTELRPAMLERGFGFGAEGDPGPLKLGEIELRGRIDRIDLAPDRQGAVVRDYKTGKAVSGAGAFADEGVLQIPLYMLAVRELLKLDPIAGLYQPLGAIGRKRRPRGLALKGDPRLEGIELVSGGGSKDLCEPEELEQALDDAAERAIAAGEEMRAGEIGRRPLGGRCSKYCEFQPICRLERALGVDDENGNGNGRAS
jgi:ATP-dependent helicase/DNAse subunit B